MTIWRHFARDHESATSEVGLWHQRLWWQQSDGKCEIPPPEEKHVHQGQNGGETPADHRLCKKMARREHKERGGGGRGGENQEGF